MIRILHVVTLMNRGGLETLLMNYYRHIDRSQVQFDFLVHRNEVCDYDEEILRLGGHIFRLPRLNPFSALYKRALRSFFTSHPEYSIVHVHQDCLSSIILKEAKNCGVPVRIGHSHLNNIDFNLKYFLKIYYRQFISKYATHLMACSQNAGEWMFKQSSFKILPNAIDVSNFGFCLEQRNEIRQKLNLSDEDIVIGHVGRFYSPKNHFFLIKIFSKLIERNHRCKLLLVGDGPLRPQIETLVKKHHLNNILFLGVRSDVNELLQAMDVFVFPSLYEGLGIVSIEAQTSGLPVFASTNVPRESDVTGLCQFLPLGNAEEWADAILAADISHRRSHIEECRKAGYDINETAQWLQNFYLELEEI